MQRVQHRQEEDAGAGDARRHVAEHVQLRPPRPPRPVLQVERHPARLERGAHRAAHVHLPRAAPAAVLAALRREPPLQLRDHAVHLREVLGGVGRQRAVELAQRLARAAAPACARSSGARARGARGARTPGARSRGTPSGSGSSAALLLALQPERAPDPLHVHADHAGALALAPEGGDREPGEVAHLAVRAGADRLADALAQRLEVEPLAAAGSAPRSGPARRASRSTARKKKRSNSTSSTCRSSCDLASVAASASRKSSCEVQLTASSASKASSSSEVPTATPSLAQLVGELEQPRRHAGAARGPAACRRRGRG